MPNLPDPLLAAAEARRLAAAPSFCATGYFFRPGIPRTGLHEVYAGQAADAPSASGFVLGGIARWLAGQPASPARRPEMSRQTSRATASAKGSVLWVRAEGLHLETGRLYPPGLAAFAIPPATVALVAAPDVTGALQAGLEAARCPALTAVMIELRGPARAYDLTASRRLARAAQDSGVAVFVLRHGADPIPSAADSRWQVRSLPSRPLAANATGFPAFEVALLRHRGGREGQRWTVEWNRDAVAFDDLSGFAPAATGDRGAALPGAVVPVPGGRADAVRGYFRAG